MSEVQRMIKCALCGTEMAADIQTCPKCGSLNAHYSYHKQFGALEDAEEAIIGSPFAPARSTPPPRSSPAPPATPATPATQTTQARESAPARRATHIPVPQGDQPPSEGMEERATLVDALNRNSARRYEQAPDTQAPSIRAGSGMNLAHYLETPPAQIEQVPDPAQWPRRVAVRRVASSPLSPERAFALEMFGYLCVMGVGHLYGGHNGRGWVLMVAWWIVLGSIILPSLRNITPAGLVVALLVYVSAPLVSGYWISSDLRRQRPIRSNR